MFKIGSSLVNVINSTDTRALQKGHLVFRSHVTGGKYSTAIRQFG